MVDATGGRENTRSAYMIQSKTGLTPDGSYPLYARWENNLLIAGGDYNLRIIDSVLSQNRESTKILRVINR